MRMWLIIMYTTLAVTLTGLFYLAGRVGNFGGIKKLAQGSRRRKFLISFLIITAAFVGIGACLNFMNAIVCVIYFAMAWVVCDVVFWCIERWRKKAFRFYYAGWTAILGTLLALSVGWYQDYHVWQTDYTIVSEKNIKPLKIAMFADSHLGTTFGAKGFAKHMATIQHQNPDAVVVVGDFVDDGTTKEDMIAACRTLGELKTPYGVYFVFGNHDKGYYGSSYRGFSGQELIDELEKNGVVVLRDEAFLVADDFYFIGRRDFSEIKERRGYRQTMVELLQTLDQSKYMVVLDHQPTDYDNQAKAGVDLVLSGHTHGGQLFPFNQVGKWIGANDLIYGHEKRNKTDFIVTSGLSDWAIKFKTGTKSEFVMLYIRPQDVKN